MLLVTGRITARPDTIDAMIALALEHVRRSRTEPGCESHAVHRDVEDPLALVFLERWTDEAALAAHFAQPASIAFVRAASGLASGRPEMRIYRAEPTRV